MYRIGRVRAYVLYVLSKYTLVVYVYYIVAVFVTSVDNAYVVAPIVRSIDSICSALGTVHIAGMRCFREAEYGNVGGISK
eukprot:611315-Pyramimonas_sp.AAC.2